MLDTFSNEIIFVQLPPPYRATIFLELVRYAPSTMETPANGSPSVPPPYFMPAAMPLPAAYPSPPIPGGLQNRPHPMSFAPGWSRWRDVSTPSIPPIPPPQIPARSLPATPGIPWMPGVPLTTKAVAPVKRSYDEIKEKHEEGRPAKRVSQSIPPVSASMLPIATDIQAQSHAMGAFAASVPNPPQQQQTSTSNIPTVGPALAAPPASNDPPRRSVKLLVRER